MFNEQNGGFVPRRGKALSDRNKAPCCCRNALRIYLLRYARFLLRPSVVQDLIILPLDCE
jgi:hypothetical protein